MSVYGVSITGYLLRYQQQLKAQEIAATIEPVLTCEDQSVRTLGCLNPSTIKCHI